MVEITEMLLPPFDKCKWQQNVARLSGVLVAFLGDSLQNYSELDSLYNEGRSRALFICAILKVDAHFSVFAYVFAIA
jgi:hypothetical protein